MSIAATLTVLCVRFGLGFLNSDALPTPGSVRESESVAVFAVIEGATVVVMVGFEVLGGTGEAEEPVPVEVLAVGVFLVEEVVPPPVVLHVAVVMPFTTRVRLSPSVPFATIPK